MHIFMNTFGKWYITYSCNYTDYGGGDHLKSDQGFVWLFGRRSKSVGACLSYGLQSVRPLCLWHKL